MRSYVPITHISVLKEFEVHAKENMVKKEKTISTKKGYRSGKVHQ
jgi:hypothetical protein